MFVQMVDFDKTSDEMRISTSSDDLMTTCQILMVMGNLYFLNQSFQIKRCIIMNLFSFVLIAACLYLIMMGGKTYSDEEPLKF